MTHPHLIAEVEGMVTAFSAVAQAAAYYYRDNPALYERTTSLLRGMKREFGLKSRLFAALGGLYVLRKIRSEEARLSRGWTYEPPTFYEINDAARLEDFPGASRCSYVIPQVSCRQAPEENPVLTEDQGVEAAEPAARFQERLV